MFKELKGTYLLACSGGPDSMALFDMLIKSNINFEVAHVNYHHRASANRDQNIVSDFAKKYGIKFHLKDYEEGTGNFQDLARVFRYDFFREIVRSNNFDGVIVAHHQDDLIETYFLQKERGSIPSTYGLANKVDLNGLNVYRPLLNYTKEDLLKYCDELIIPYGIDESNLTCDYKRNEIRHNIVEKMSLDDRKVILSKIDNLNSELINRRELIKKYLDKEYLSVSEYQNIEDKEMYLRLKIDLGLSKDFIEELNKQLLNSEKVNLKYKNLIISKEYQNISIFTCTSDYEYIIEEGQVIETPYFTFKDQGTNFEAINLKGDDYPITVRNYKQGDSILMRYGSKKVNRFFIDKKIPLKERNIWPVVLNSKGEVIHVPGIGSDVNHFAKEPTFFMVKL